MAKKNKPEGKKYSYMDTYGDLVTLLLCFFVLLFAMSSIDESKYNAFVEALSNRFGPAPTNLSAMGPDASVSGNDYGSSTPTGEAVDPDPSKPADFSPVHEAIEQYIEENNLASQVSVTMGPSGSSYLRLSDALVFEGNSSVLTQAAMDFMDFMGVLFLELESDVFQINVMGHTASIPGSRVDDWYLSGERSAAVASYFENRIGFTPYKVEGRAYGRHYPIADNGTSEGIARNRRVDIVVINNNPATLAQALAEVAAVYFPNDDTQYFEGGPEELPGTVLQDIPALDGKVSIDNMTEEDILALMEALENHS